MVLLYVGKEGRYDSFSLNSQMWPKDLVYDPIIKLF